MLWGDSAAANQSHPSSLSLRTSAFLALDRTCMSHFSRKWRVPSLAPDPCVLDHSRTWDQFAPDYPHPLPTRTISMSMRRQMACANSRFIVCTAKPDRMRSLLGFLPRCGDLAEANGSLWCCFRRHTSPMQYHFSMSHEVPE